MENEESSLRRKFSSVWLLLDERSRRLMAASEALALGYGGVSRIRRASGLSRKAIAKGIREIADGNAMPGRAQVVQALLLVPADAHHRRGHLGWPTETANNVEVSTYQKLGVHVFRIQLQYPLVIVACAHGAPQCGEPD